MTAAVSAETFVLQARLILGHRCNTSPATEDRRFRANFGTTPAICAILWGMISPNETMPKGVKYFHLLWALMFLKLYASEHVLSGIAKCDEKTYRKWTWLFIMALADLVPECVSTVAVCCCVQTNFENPSVSKFVIWDS